GRDGPHPARLAEIAPGLLALRRETAEADLAESRKGNADRRDRLGGGRAGAPIRRLTEVGVESGRDLVELGPGAGAEGIGEGGCPRGAAARGDDVPAARPQIPAVRRARAAGRSGPEPAAPGAAVGTRAAILSAARAGLAGITGAVAAVAGRA